MRRVSSRFVWTGDSFRISEKGEVEVDDPHEEGVIYYYRLPWYKRWRLRPILRWLGRRNEPGYFSRKGRDR
jgi:hypothetical protein